MLSAHLTHQCTITVLSITLGSGKSKLQPLQMNIVYKYRLSKIIFDTVTVATELCKFVTLRESSGWESDFSFIGQMKMLFIISFHLIS